MASKSNNVVAPSSSSILSRFVRTGGKGREAGTRLPATIALWKALDEALENAEHLTDTLVVIEVPMSPDRTVAATRAQVAAWCAAKGHTFGRFTTTLTTDTGKTVERVFKGFSVDSKGLAIAVLNPATATADE